MICKINVQCYQLKLSEEQLKKELNNNNLMNYNNYQTNKKKT